MDHFRPRQRPAEREAVTAAARRSTLSAYNFGRFRLAGDGIHRRRPREARHPPVGAPNRRPIPIICRRQV